MGFNIKERPISFRVNLLIRPLVPLITMALVGRTKGVDNHLSMVCTLRVINMHFLDPLIIEVYKLWLHMLVPVVA